VRESLVFLCVGLTSFVAFLAVAMLVVWKRSTTTTTAMGLLNLLHDDGDGEQTLPLLCLKYEMGAPERKQHNKSNHKDFMGV